MSWEQAVEVFAIGGESGALSVSLPLGWAKEHSGVQVISTDGGDQLGWHLHLESDDGDQLMSFPWHDHVQRMLRGEVRQELPVELGDDGRWSDLEQGWWASATQVGDVVYLAESDFDELSKVSPAATAQRVAQGQVVVGGVEISWNAVPVAAYQAAWRAAREACSTGDLRPKAE